MTWAIPQNWTAEEDVGVTDMHTRVRDQLLSVQANIKGFGFSAGEGNDAGGADTQLTSYDVAILGGTVVNPGNGLLVEGTLSVSTPSEAKTCKIQIDSATLVTLYTATAASHIVPFRVILRRRTSTTGSITGITWVGAAAGGAPTNYLVNSALGTVAWAGAQTLKIFLSGTTADSIKLTDYNVSLIQGDGATV